MASQSLISAVNSYDNYIQRKGIDEQVIDAYIEACRVAINGEKDITYGLQITNRSKGIVERFCMERTGGTIWDLEKYSFANKTHYSLTDKLYDVLLLEAQNKVVDSAYRYLEKKREPRERFYMPRRKTQNETIVIYRKDNKVIALDKSTGEKAEAKCNPADEFDFRTGAKLAFNRLMGEDVKLDNGVREVKRKAKVGEYVKVVNEKSVFNTYKNGEIFKVTYVTKSGCICKNSEKQCGLWHEEYVVLENYKLEEKVQEQNDNEIHVGDMVEVARSGGCYPTYDTWSGLGSYRQNFVKGVSVEDGMVAKVLNIAKHDRLHNFCLALIQNPKTSQVFIIKIDGIKKVER